MSVFQSSCVCVRACVRVFIYFIFLINLMMAYQAETCCQTDTRIKQLCWTIRLHCMTTFCSFLSRCGVVRTDNGKIPLNIGGKTRVFSNTSLYVVRYCQLCSPVSVHRFWESMSASYVIRYVVCVTNLSFSTFSITCLINLCTHFLIVTFFYRAIFT